MPSDTAWMRPSGDPGTDTRSAWQKLGLFVAILAVLGSAAVWIWQRGAEGRAVQELSAEDRQLVYSRTMENLRLLCADGRPSLYAYCRREAEFILNFPECDANCHTIAKPFVSPGPAR